MESGKNGVSTSVLCGSLITNEERKEIDWLSAVMKDILQKCPAYDTDFALLRWLRACDHDREKTVEQMSWALNALSCLHILDKDLSTIPKINQQMNVVTPLSAYFPGGIIGTDKHGNVLVMNGTGDLRPRQLLHCTTNADFFIAALTEAEGIQTLLRAEEKKRNRKLGVVMVTDLSGYSLELVASLTAIKMYLNLMTLLQRAFVDTAAKIYVINVPSAVEIIWTMMKKVLTQDTIEKIEIVGNDWKELLIRNHGAENIPKRWGGTLEKSYVKEAKVLTDELRETFLPKRCAFDELEKVTVNARSVVKIPIRVNSAGTKLSWYFECVSGAIDFCVLHNGNEVGNSLI
ncbi:unnamed protein product [Anisakis simplex]|uniref:CRAL-TRIO domain-containing protein n=1 Tax=Anisakis simplex TaxID=6269 RepID=A0A0M3KAE5_ANISI|nr:unnamed protein product [Anisakis simplex]